MVLRWEMAPLQVDKSKSPRNAIRSQVICGDSRSLEPDTSPTKNSVFTVRQKKVWDGAYWLRLVT
jgi:hypothetical protein